MATHLTLEEAAGQLGIPTEEFKRRLKTDPVFKTLVPIRDGSTLRFKSTAIDELARQLGAASNPELPLAPLESSVTPDSDDFKVSTGGPASGVKSKGAAKKPAEEALNLDASDDDVFSLAPDAKGEKKGKKPGSDSDVRLEKGKAKKRNVESDSSDEAVVPTEELSIDFNGPGSAVIKGGSSAKLSAPKSSGKIPKPDSGKSLSNPGSSGSDSSEFELSLDADSDDFELKLNTDASDEVDLGEMPKDTSGRRSAESGINLKDPADSGISLEKNKKKGSDDKHKKPAPAPAKEPESNDSSDLDFELTLDSSAAASSLKLGNLKTGKGVTDPDSDSEFELTLDDSGDSAVEAGSADAEKGDIFETDFVIPPMDESGSEAVALDSESDAEASDVELEESSDVEEDVSGSEAVVLDDEEVEAPKAKKKGAARKAADVEEDVDLADVDLAEDDASASKALKGVRGGSDEDEEAEVVGAGAYRPVPWGPLPALMLFPATVLLLVGGLVGFEVTQTMLGYQQPRKPAAPLVRAIASNLDMELKDQ